MLTLPPPPAGRAPSKEVQLLMQDPTHRRPKDELLQWQVLHPSFASWMTLQSLTSLSGCQASPT